mgnify:CR=1 FL=1
MKYIRNCSLVAVISFGLMTTGCNPLQFIKDNRGLEQVAVVSQKAYLSVAEPVRDKIVKLVNKNKVDGQTLTDNEKYVLRKLSDFKKVLDDYSKVHNKYVASLKIVRETGFYSADFGDLYSELKEFLVKAKDIKEFIK